MAKTKEPPKPMFGLKHDFYASLDHTLQQALNLMSAVDQAIQLGAITSGPVKDLLTKQSTALRQALMADD